ncbi:MAG TPA: NAD-dependent epimerase/dehydratase family protein [Acidimicrobiia bacterium]|nr:NAD-dependent epimerase/dehydratase family protein [Acidimicrobiia bacterium]
MDVLVTGGAGFIGSHVVDALVAAGYGVRVLDAAGARRNGVDVHRADVRDPDAVAAAVAGIDAVCHQAAMVGLGVDFADAPAYVSHNDAGTAVLLAALHERGFRGRFVLASSMVVYGEGRYRCAVHGLVRPGPRDPVRLNAGEWDPCCSSCGGSLVPEGVPEEAPADPRNVYAATKLHQEHLCFAFGREHGVPVTALRYHNVYGARMPRDTPYAGVAAIFRSAIESGRAPRVLEDGQQRRDFVHVRDIAHANVLALTADAPATGPLNIASGATHTVLDLAHALTTAAGSEAPEPAVVGGYRIGDVRHVFADPQRARTQLGFTATVPFDEGVHEFASAPLRAAEPQ